MASRSLTTVAFLVCSACAEPSASPPASSDAVTTAASTTAALSVALSADPVAPPLPGTSAGASLTPSTTASAKPAPFRYVVAAMGDSLTDPKSHGAKYLDLLRERCPESSFSAFGKGGNMVNMMRKRFLRDVYGESPDGKVTEARPKFTHVLILGGLGDVLSNETAFRTAEKISKDIGEMVDLSRARGAKAIVLTLPPWGGMKAFNTERAKMTLDVNAWIEGAAKSGRIDGYFDTRPLLTCGNEHRLCDRFSWADGIHWSEAGHRAVGEGLYRAVFADCE